MTTEEKQNMILMRIAPNLHRIEGKSKKEVYYDGWTDCYEALSRLASEQDTGGDKTS